MSEGDLGALTAEGKVVLLGFLSLGSEERRLLMELIPDMSRPENLKENRDWVQRYQTGPLPGRCPCCGR